MSSDDVVDPDIDLHDARQLAETRPRQWDILFAIAVGGVIGAEARYGLGQALPHHGQQFPWSTLAINLSGCFALGVLMALLNLGTPHRLTRPLLGVGILGGYTTFSTFAIDADRLFADHRLLVAVEYLIATVIGCAIAVWLASLATSALGRLVRRTAGQP